MISPGIGSLYLRFFQLKYYINILVFSAKENQFDVTFHKEQLKEHAPLRRTSVLDNVIATVNKMDLAG